MSKNILVVTHDYIGEKMAGIGLRHWELSHSLGKFFNVTLATPHNTSLESDTIQVIPFKLTQKRLLSDLVKKSDVVISLAYMADLISDIVKKNKKSFVIDLVCPYHLEELEFSKFQYSKSPDLCDARYIQTLESVRNQMKIGDFFICASEKQRDYWLGLLSGENRLNSYIYKGDKSFKNLIDVVPYGISSNPPVHKKQMIKEVWKNITKKDFVILWGGGIWNWFDPLTLIRAMAIIKKKQKNIKLVFMGVQHPDKNNVHEITGKAIELSKSLELYDETVFFYSDWVPYRERENCLLESDIGVISHFNHIENRFSFRTRIMDYLWAGLPIISTKGDCMSDLIEKHQLGIVVDYEDINGWANSILSLCNNKRLREKFSNNTARLIHKFTWDNVSQPLIDFCKNADKRRKVNEKKVVLNTPFPVEDLFKNKKIKKILVLRSSPVYQFFDSIRYIKKTFKDATIEMIAQKDIGALMKKKYPESKVFIYKYKNFDKHKIRDKELKIITQKKYDLLIYTVNSFSNYGYKNVEDFGLQFNSKLYLAINQKGLFSKIEK